MYKKVMSAQLKGIEGQVCYVEADSSNGFPNFDLVGNLSGSVRENSDRVLSIINKQNIEVPRKKVVLNIAPADEKKEGTSFDFPIFLTYYLSLDKELNDQMNEMNELDIQIGAIGEIDLDGNIRGIRGSYELCEKMKDEGLHVCFIGYEDYIKCKSLEGNTFNFIVCENVKDAINKLKNYHIINTFNKHFSSFDNNILKKIENELKNKTYANIYDYGNNQYDVSDLINDKKEKFFKIALASYISGLNMNIDGKIGDGTDMYVKRILGCLPDLNYKEKKEVFKVYDSVLNVKDCRVDDIKRPIRMPHYSVSLVSLTGGGIYITAGEMSLAHKGVLYLEDIDKYSKYTLEMLGDVNDKLLKNDHIDINRLRGVITFPKENFTITSINREDYYDKTANKKLDNFITKDLKKLGVSVNINFNDFSIDYKNFDKNNNNKDITSSDLKKQCEEAIKLYSDALKQNEYNNVNFIKDYSCDFDKLCLALACLDGRQKIHDEDINFAKEVWIGEEKSLLLEKFETIEKASDLKNKYSVKENNAIKQKIVKNKERRV